jgi:hypothetical protein
MYATAKFPLANAEALKPEDAEVIWRPPSAEHCLAALWHDVKRRRPRRNSDTLEGK